MNIKEKIIEWANDQQILKNSTPETLMLKTTEEVGELAKAINIKNIDKIMDEIGDIVVTLVIQAKLNHVDFDDCVSLAYHTLKYRKGKIVDGIFIKDT